MQIHAAIDCSLVNGPGRRTVIWFQGCDINGIGKPHCPGCWNPLTHARLRGFPASSDELISRILKAHRELGTEGVTLSRGEPIHQIDSALALLTVLRSRLTNFTAGLFTGYTRSELGAGRFTTYSPSDPLSRHESWRRLEQLLDFAVFGRFHQRQPTSEPLVSSRNQQLCLLSNRYQRHQFAPQMAEVTIDPEGLTQITGFPTLGSL
jgi:anaerobic ribonucleoside-triphosphate reductase activating protein